MPNSLRFISGAGQDNTFRTVTQDAATIAYAATVAITPVQQVNLYNMAQLTGTMTINATVTNLYIGDTVRFIFSSDATARVVTFGTNFLSASTLSVTASKTASIEFIFNGTNLIETGRAVTA